MDVTNKKGCALKVVFYYIWIFFIKGHNELHDLVDSYFSFWFDDYSFYIQYNEWQQKKSQGWTSTLLTWTHVKTYQGLGCVCGCYLFTYFDHQLLWIVQEPTPHPFFLQPNDETLWTPNIVNYMNLLWFSIVLLHGTCFYFNGDIMGFQLLWILVVV